LLQIISRLLPLTYSIEAMKEGMANTSVTGTYLLDISILVFFSIIIMIVSTKMLEKRLS
jgi:ABC-type multidrug transport system permease subunit